MQKKLVLRSAKLSSQNPRLKSVNSVCISYEHSPVDPEERHHGVLFAVLGLQCDPRKSEDLIELILETFHGEYYQDLDKPPLSSFENALTKINEELGDYTNNGNTFWMGKLNAVLGVYADNVLHLTQAGGTEAFLFRNEKRSEITKDLKGDNLNPLRTFINIASGEVAEGDKVAIISSGILNSASPGEISEYIIKYHPKVAIGSLAELLSGLGGTRGQNGAVIIEFLSPEALANETLDEEPDEVWLEPKKGEKAGEYSLSFLMKFFSILATAYRYVRVFLVSSAIPASRRLYAKIRPSSSSQRKKAPQETILAETQESIFSDDPLTEEETNRSKTGYKSEIRIKEGEEFPVLAGLQKSKKGLSVKAWDFLDDIRRFFLTQARRKKPSVLKKIKKVYLIYAAIAIVILLIPFLYLQNKNEAKADDRKQQIAQLAELDQRYQSALSSADSDKKKAAEILAQIRADYEKFQNSAYFSQEAAEKTNQIEKEINRITNTKALALTRFAAFEEVADSDLVGSFKIEDNFYAVGKNGKFFERDAEGKISQLSVSGTITGEILAATALPRIRTIEILTNTPNVYELDLDNNTIEPKTATDGWSPALAIDSYGTNLYLLSKEQSQLYKYVRTATGYGKGASQIAENSVIRNPFSLAIDSDVYILNQGGEILKFTSGIRQDYTITGLPFDLENADSIFAAADYSNIFVGSKKSKSVIVIGKDGAYKGRFTANEIEKISNIFVDGTTLYLTAGKNLYTFGVE